MITAADALRPERIDRDQRHQRGVDPPREGERPRARIRSSRRSRAARARAPRRPPASSRERLGQLRARPGPRPRLRCAARRAPARFLPGVGCTSAIPAGVAEGGQKHVADQQLGLELGGRGRWSSPSGAITTLAPSKTSSSWPPTVLQSANAAPMSRACSASIASRAAILPRWYGEADELTIRWAPHVASSRLGEARDPDVLADRQPDHRAVDVEAWRPRGRARSSGARRRRRSWAGGSSGRPRAPRRRPAGRRRCMPAEGADR